MGNSEIQMGIRKTKWEFRKRNRTSEIRTEAPKSECELGNPKEVAKPNGNSKNGIGTSKGVPQFPTMLLCASLVLTPKLEVNCLTALQQPSNRWRLRSRRQRQARIPWAASAGGEDASWVATGPTTHLLITRARRGATADKRLAFYERGCQEKHLPADGPPGQNRCRGSQPQFRRDELGSDFWNVDRSSQRGAVFRN